MAFHTFSHVLALDMNFHIKRRTGDLSRKLERGTRSISMVFRAVVFTFLPTALELALVCGILWKQFSAPVAGKPTHGVEQWAHRGQRKQRG